MYFINEKINHANPFVKHFQDQDALMFQAELPTKCSKKRFHTDCKITKLKICYCSNHIEEYIPSEEQKKKAGLLNFQDIYYSGTDIDLPSRASYQKKKINEQFKCLPDEQGICYLSKRAHCQLYGDDFKEKLVRYQTKNRQQAEQSNETQQFNHRSYSKRGQFHNDSDFTLDPAKTNYGDSKGHQDEDFLVCKSCKTECLLTSIDPPLIKEFVMRFHQWLCPDCKICSLCNKNTADQKMLFCDLCDRGFDQDCLGLQDVPEEDWYCQDCCYCNSCGKVQIDNNVSNTNLREQINELKSNINGSQILCKNCLTRKETEKQRYHGLRHTNR